MHIDRSFFFLTLYIFLNKYVTTYKPISIQNILCKLRCSASFIFSYILIFIIFVYYDKTMKPNNGHDYLYCVASISKLNVITNYNVSKFR